MPLNLLATKFHRPTSPQWFVQRRSLVQRLDEGLSAGHPLTLVSAPAGFGKSTCASEWLGGLGVAAAWLSLDPSDDDLARFFAYFIAALQKIDGNIGQEIEGVFQTGQAPLIENVVTSLLNDVQRSEKQFVLALDDFQSIKEESILKAIAAMLSAAPPNLHLVLVTRADPQLPLARLRANNQLTEIRAGDLRFSPDEVDHFLNRGMGLNLTTGDISLLEERTEGWAAGIQLAGLSMRGREDPSAFISSLSGSQRHILGYLTEEALNRQPQEVQTFLLRTSLLERFCADLCRALTGNLQSRALLGKLFASNLFVISLDEAGEWFRYHHLFADLLRSQLHQTETENTIRTLHKKAADWLQAHDQFDEAIQHNLAAGDFEHASGLIEQHAYQVLTRGELTTLLRWMNSLPAELALRRPLLFLAKLWVLLFAGAPMEIEALIQQADRQLAGDTTSENALLIRGSGDAARAFFKLMAGDHAQALILAESARANISALAPGSLASNPYISSALSVLPYTLGMVYRGRGEYEKAAQAFTEETAMFQSPESVLTWAIAITEVAAVRRMQGRLRTAEEVCRSAMQHLHASGARPYGPLARIDVALSEVLREHRQLEEAHRLAAGAIDRVKSWNMPTDRLAFYLSLLRTQLSERDFAGAHATLETAKQIRAAAPVFLDLTRSVDALEIRLALLEGDVSSAQSRMDALRPGSSGLVYLDDQETILLARLRLAQGQPGEAGKMLAPAITKLDDGSWGSATVEMLSLLAHVWRVQGNTAAAADLLLKTLRLAEPEGFEQVFIDEGEAVRELLLFARNQLEAQHDPADAAVKRCVDRLIAAFPVEKGALALSPSTANSAGLLEPLTEREREVLRLIADGLKYEEIAGKLFISLNTVRTYVKAIYRKLSVDSRSKAVALARQLDLL